MGKCSNASCVQQIRSRTTAMFAKKHFAKSAYQNGLAEITLVLTAGIRDQ